MDADDPICLKCIGDDELRRLLSEKASRSVCASCGKRRRAALLREVAEHIDGVYGEYYAPGGDVAHFDKDSDNPRYEQEGEAPEWIIQEIAGVEPDISEAVVEYLDYDTTSRYVARDLPPTELRLAWGEFRQRVKHERRFFDEEGRTILSTILGDRESIRHPDNPLSACIVTLKAGERYFRARRADTKEAADIIIGDPRRELGPPAPHRAPAGRMNPVGIPVFYGGFSEDVCIAEVRPHVGGIVVVGEFRAVRRLRLLDLTMLDRRGFVGSMFRADYYDRVTKHQFLRSFHNLISRPVQPHEEALEYVPTQAVAEYIGNVLGLDGIIYESAQTGGLNNEEDEEDTPADRSTQNVAFFSQAALVVASRRRQTRAERQAAILEGEGLSYHVSKQSRPSLSFVRHSAKSVRVTAIKVSHVREF